MSSQSNAEEQHHQHDKEEAIDWQNEFCKLKEEVSQHKKKHGTRQVAWVTVLSAVLGLIGGISTSYLKSVPEYQTVMKTYLSGLQGGYNDEYYDEQIHTMREIAAVHGTKMAVQITRRFRTGPTIRVLEEIAASASHKEKAEIKKCLKPIKRILVIDSTEPSNVYSDLTKGLAGTNVDDIAEKIRMLPIRMIGRKVDRTWGLENEQEVIELDPNLIVMHMGSFEVPGKEKDIETAAGFIARVSSELVDTYFLVYSRQGGATGGALSEMKEIILKKVGTDIESVGLARRICLLDVQGFGEEDANRLRTAIRRILDLDRLYERSWN